MKRYNGYIVGLSEGAMKALEEAHAICWADRLAETVSTFRVGESGYDVETSDNAVSVAGLPLSFLRNNKDMTIMIMTVEEAKALDQVKINPETLKEVLGHSDYAKTMELYTHVVENTKQ